MIRLPPSNDTIFGSDVGEGGSEGARERGFLRDKNRRRSDTHHSLNSAISGFCGEVHLSCALLSSPDFTVDCRNVGAFGDREIARFVRLEIRFCF